MIFLIHIDIKISRMPVVEEVISTAAEYVLPKLDSIFSLMGIPSILKTDNGPPFIGHKFEEFCKYFGIKHRIIHRQMKRLKRL